jgi:hypothetical protein
LQRAQRAQHCRVWPEVQSILSRNKEKNKTAVCTNQVIYHHLALIRNQFRNILRRLPKIKQLTIDQSGGKKME